MGRMGEGLTVDVVSTTGVVAWEDGFELSNAGRVGLLDSTAEGGVDVALIVDVAVSLSYDAGVDALFWG